MKRDVFSAEDPARDSWSKTLHLPKSGAHAALPPGTRVGEVEIAGVIGEGSAGIVYGAVDPSLERRVAVKEYLPSALASRAPGGQVVVRSKGAMAAFRAGLDGFIAEARLLARFDHPSLVKVYRVWEANGTAYLVMPYYEGPTLTRMLANRGDAPDEATLRGWLVPLLEALEMIHRAGQLHRDISADNILLTTSGPVLLDFGVARRAIGDTTHAPTVVLQRGYAPIEQYGESDALKPGPWTDLYALGCVLHLAITGEAPTLSVERLWDDWREPLSLTAQGRYSSRFLAAVDAMLAVRPVDRPQDVAGLRALLATEGEGVEAIPPVAVSVAAAAPLVPERSTRSATAVDPLPAVADSRVRLGLHRSVVLAFASAAMALGLGLAVRYGTAPVEAAEDMPTAGTGTAVSSRFSMPSIQPTAVARPNPPEASGALAIALPEPAPRTTVVPVDTSAVERQATPTRSQQRVPNPVSSEVVTRTAARPVVDLPDPAAVIASARSAGVPSSAHWPARCFDVLQKASLERVTDEETTFLREACR